jgi:peptidoglycan hydrolase CwlO-like protein
MQSMNQSLIALLAHNQITYEQAVSASLEPDDLSLKLRKMFPSIEERFREGEMAPSPADFSEITGLLETKRLYEEAEDRHRQKIAERDEVIRDLERELAELRTQAEETSSGVDALRREADLAKAEAARVREESQGKINALNERIRDLNQQLTGNGKGAGFFKR